MTEVPVQWPGKAYAADKDDLAAPIKALLTQLNLLEDPNPGEKVSWAEGTPQSLQVMTSGATSMSKLVAALVAGGGGIAAIATGLKGFFTTVGGTEGGLDTPLVRTAFILGGSFLGAAVVIALAVVVRSDVTARAQATAAQFRARGEVASALLTSFVAPATPATPTPPTPGYAVRTSNGSWVMVEEFSWSAGVLKAQVDGDLMPVSEWSGIIRCPGGAPPVALN